MVETVRKLLYKRVGKTFFTWNELEGVLLDAEIVLNNRPLSYIEVVAQMPILKPNSLIYNSTLIPKDDPGRSRS